MEKKRSDGSGQLLAKLLFSVIPAPEALLLDEAHTLLTQKLRELQAAASETWVEETFQALAVRLCAPLANNTNCSQLIEQAKTFYTRKLQRADQLGAAG